MIQCTKKRKPLLEQKDLFFFFFCLRNLLVLFVRAAACVDCKGIPSKE